MTAVEAEKFRAHPDWRLALALREIDDRGKVRGALVPGLEDYIPDLRRVVTGHLQTGR